MSSSIKERTQKDLIEYIRTHSKDGKLTQSLLDIASEIGYSNATIHRTLKALEEKGVLEIKSPEKPTEPNTIIYKGNINHVDHLVAKGIQLSTDIQRISNDLQEFIRESHVTLRQLCEKVEQLNKDHVISVTDIPGTDLQQILVRKSEQLEI